MSKQQKNIPLSEELDPTTRYPKDHGLLAVENHKMRREILKDKDLKRRLDDVTRLVRSLG